MTITVAGYGREGVSLTTDTENGSTELRGRKLLRGLTDWHTKIVTVR